MAKKKQNISFLSAFIALGAIFIFSKKIKKVAGIGALNTKYFEVTPETTIDDLKKQYYRLAKIHHPDTGGTNDGFRDMNDEYERLQNIILTQGGFTGAERTNEQNISEIYRDIINTIITIPNITIELIGSWIWIGGNTYPVKDQIKAAGFKFHSKKVMWFWHPGEYRRFNGEEMSIEEIRSKYGSQEIKSKPVYNQLRGIDSLADKLIKLQKLLMKRDASNDYTVN